MDRIHARCFVIRADFRDEFDESGTWNPVLKAVVPTDQNVYLFSATHPTLTPRFRARGKLSQGTTKKKKRKITSIFQFPPSQVVRLSTFFRLRRGPEARFIWVTSSGAASRSERETHFTIVCFLLCCFSHLWRTRSAGVFGRHF